jgi:hypothetical protein
LTVVSLRGQADVPNFTGLYNDKRLADLCTERQHVPHATRSRADDYDPER